MHLYNLSLEWLEVLESYLKDELKLSDKEMEIYNKAFILGVYGGDEIANSYKSPEDKKIWSIGFLTGQDCIKKHLSKTQ